MTSSHDLLAVIPARGGSKALPGKNTRSFLGLPLVVHSILFAKMCPEIDRLIVSTDSAEIAAIARDFDAEVPFTRPATLAEDTTPMWPVIRHALCTMEQEEGGRYDLVLLLDPTSPARVRDDVTQALARLRAEPEADGIIGVSQPPFNPIWHCVVEREGFMADIASDGIQFDRRQDVPPVYRINGSLYLWRAEFVRAQGESWREGRHLLYEMPELRSMSIDDRQQFQHAELLVRGGLIDFPWLSRVDDATG